MKVAGLYAAIAVAHMVAASPAFNYVLHEKRNVDNHMWSKQYAASAHRVLPLSIALKEQNHDRASHWLHEVSDPTSEKYGQHWTADQIANTFRPSDETIQVVRDWLVSSGITSDRVKLSAAKNWLRLNATVAEAEKLFQTKYHTFKHSSGVKQVACDEIYLPSHLSSHVDFVTPSVHLDAKIDRLDPPEIGHSFRKRETAVDKHNVRPGTAKNAGWDRWNRPKKGPWLNNPFFGDLSNCSRLIVPDCLRALYSFGYDTRRRPNPKNSYGIVEYTPESYLPSDLDLFFANYSKSQVGQRPIEIDIDGGYQQTTNQSFDFQGEPDLDLEYAMALVNPNPVTLYQVGDAVEGASFNDFLDALDGSYCTYEGGDDPMQDAVYPDVAAGGYKGAKQCGGAPLSKVISTSYSYNEADLTPFYEQRQCNEYMKLGLMGTSVLYSSGDYGVAGNGGLCIDPVTGNYTNGTSGIFNPSFPGTCPYILSIGATQIPNNTNLVQALATHTQPETACETVIYSGGGFSNVFPLPDYQKSAVKSWFKNYPPPYGADRFNNSQQTRGLPDVSANGANYAVAVDGRFAKVYGTSASSPTFGSVLTLINEQRLNIGKSSIGFVNPVLYAHPEVLNDVTQGGNQGCGTPGFSASKGWDPVTGLGTPNYPKMLALFLSLP